MPFSVGKDEFLTDFSQDSLADIVEENRFIASAVMGDEVEVGALGGKFETIDLSQLRNANTLAAGDADTNVISLEKGAASYAIKDYRIAAQYNKKSIKGNPKGEDGERLTKTRLATYYWLTGREIAAASLVNSIATATPAGAVWSLPAADIVGDLGKLADAVFARTGQTPNNLELPRSLYRQMRVNEGFIKQIKGGAEKQALSEADVIAVLESIFDASNLKLHIGRAVYNSAQADVANTKTMSQVWGTSTAVAYFNGSMRESPRCFTSFVDPDPMVNGIFISPGTDQAKGSVDVAMQRYLDDTITNADYGQKLTGAA